MRVISTFRLVGGVEKREYYFMNTFPIARNFVSREGKREKKAKTPHPLPTTSTTLVNGMKCKECEEVKGIEYKGCKTYPRGTW